MLRLTMETGDYFTIGDDIVVQIHRIDSQRFRVSIEAPQEIPIVRGAVLEREGGERPEGLQTGPCLRKQYRDRRQRQKKQAGGLN